LTSIIQVRDAMGAMKDEKKDEKKEDKK